MNKPSILILLLGLLWFSPISNPSTVAQARPNAVFTVNSTLDATDANPGDGICETASSNGLCTLRAAIQETNALTGTDLIIVPSGIYTLTIAGAGEDNAVTGDLDIKDDLVIIGAGPEETIIDGNGLDRVFDVFAPAKVTIAGLMVRNGFNSNSFTGGGGIRNGGQLSINNSTVSGNIDEYYGGGVYNQGTLRLDNVTITNNAGKTRYFFQNGVGGGIYNSRGTLTIDHSFIMSNTAEHYGGGIYSYSGELTIDHSSITNNMTKPGNAYRYGEGGGIYISSGSLTVNHSLIMSNTADYIGGGIYNHSGDLAINHSQILSNTVARQGDGTGGGIVSVSDTNVKPTTRLDNVTVSGNSARLVGGVISNGTMTATNSHFDNNIGFGPDGFFSGLGNGNDGSMTLTDVTVNGNVSPYFSGLVNSGILTISNSVVSGNAAKYYSGVFHSGLLTMTNSVVSNNFSTNDVSGLYSLDEYGCSRLYAPIANAPILGVNNLLAPSQSLYDGILSLNNVTITNNTAGNSYAGFGNAITATITSVLIQGNKANYYAGASNCGTVTMTNSSVVGNTANKDGSGMTTQTARPFYARPSNAILVNVTISGNRALAGYGGGILATSFPGSPYTSSLQLLNVTLNNNSAITGSNLAILTSTISLKNTLIANGMTSDNCYVISGTLTSLGHNLEDADTCGLTASGDLTNRDPLLGPLQDNGGNTLTHALELGSPAVDAGDTVGCPLTDQRGVHRPFGYACDIGAFELQYPFRLPLIFYTAP